VAVAVPCVRSDRQAAASSAVCDEPTRRGVEEKGDDGTAARCRCREAQEQERRADETNRVYCQVGPALTSRLSGRWDHA